MLFKVVALRACESFLPAADLARKVADPHDDLALEQVRGDVDWTRDVVVDWNNGELVARRSARHFKLWHGCNALLARLAGGNKTRYTLRKKQVADQVALASASSVNSVFSRHIPSQQHNTLHCTDIVSPVISWLDSILAGA